MKPVIIRKKRSGQAVVLFCSIMFFVFFLLMIFSNEIAENFRGFFSAIGWAGSILGGINLIWKLWRFIRPRPLLVANQDGLGDYSTTSSLGFIPWEEIGSIALFTAHGERFVGVELPRIRELLENEGNRYTAAQKNTVKSNLSLHYPPMLIHLAAAGQDPSSMADFLKDYQEKALLEKERSDPKDENAAGQASSPLRLAFPPHLKKG